MDKKIRTRQIHKDIKVLDKAVTGTERIKRAYVRTKDSAEQTRDTEYATPVDYAESKISNSADTAAHETARTARIAAETSLKTAEKAAVAARQAARTAAQSARAAARATVAAVRAIIAATKALISAIWAGGWIAVLILVVVILFGGVLCMVDGDLILCRVQKEPLIPNIQDSPMVSLIRNIRLPVVCRN